MKKRFLLLPILLLALSITVSAGQPMRAVQLNVLGVSGLAGVSFDSRFTEGSNFGYKIGVGYGYAKETSDYFMITSLQSITHHAVVMPLNAYYLVGKSKNFLELKAGIVPNYWRDNYYMKNKTNTVQDNGIGYFSMLGIGYRFEGKKIVLTAGVDMPIKTPGANLKKNIFFSPQLSLGYIF